MILLWRRPGQKYFLIVYCALFSLTWFGDCSILYVLQQWQHKGSLKHSRRHNMKHCNQWRFLSNFQNVKSPRANVKPHIVKTFCRRFWFQSHMLSRDRFVATSVRFSAVWKRRKRANREPTSCNHLGAFCLDVFRSCVWDFYIRGKRVATWSTRCALTSLCRHTYVQGVCFFEYR